MECENCQDHSGHDERLNALSGRIDRLREVVKGKIGQAAMMVVLLGIVGSILLQTAAYLQGQNNGTALVRIDERLKSHMQTTNKAGNTDAVYTFEEASK